MENVYPSLNKISLTSSHFTQEVSNLTFKKCHECHKKVLLHDYHYGSMDNNMDEWLSGNCLNCNESISWEPNFDGYYNMISSERINNNIIVYGKYINYTKSKLIHQETIKKEKFIEIIKTKEIYEIEAPIKKLDKVQLQNYIDENIEFINYSMCFCFIYFIVFNL